METTITSALIGGLTALIVVAVTSCVALWQLKHDREQRATDRALQAKRELLVESLRSAIVLMGSAAELGRPKVDIERISAKFTSNMATMNAASAVANLETMSRGAEFMNSVAPVFIAAMTERALLGVDATQAQLAKFSMDVVKAQRNYQASYARLVGAVRRDLGVAASSDKEIAAALAYDADSVESFTSEMLNRLAP